MLVQIGLGILFLFYLYHYHNLTILCYTIGFKNPHPFICLIHPSINWKEDQGSTKLNKKLNTTQFFPSRLMINQIRWRLNVMLNFPTSLRHFPESPESSVELSSSSDELCCSGSSASSSSGSDSKGCSNKNHKLKDQPCRMSAYCLTVKKIFH